ncbi:MAG: TetR/AcrR family transcriptional regulator [Halieaceae bacterium]|nr:TetR/AcrR family transcriptional regulator [Halieaceae bacterium]
MANTNKKPRARNTRDAILRVACEKYLESGDQGLSMRNIAKELGITPMAIYKHFDNKEALQQQLLAEAFRTFMEYLSVGLEGRDARERFHLTAEAYFEFAVRQSTYFELIFLAINPMNNLKLQDAIREESIPPFRFLVDRVRDCIEEGYFRAGDAYQMSVSLLAQSTGLAALFLTRSFPWTEDEAREMQQKVLEQILGGFLDESN